LPSPAAPPQPPAPTSPAVPTTAPATSNAVTLPTPGAVTPTPAGPAPSPTLDDTPTAAGAVRAPQPPDQAVTNRRSPTDRTAPAQLPETSVPQLNRPEWAGGDAQPAPASPPCTTDCTGPTPTRTPTHWSPNTP